MKITNQWLIDNAACEDGTAWFNNQTTTDAIEVLKALLQESKFGWANWTITKLLTQKQNILFACYAAKLSLKFFESAYPKDRQPRNAILAAERFARNPTAKNKKALVSAAESAAESATRSAAWLEATRSAAWSAWSAARSAAGSAAWSAWSARSAARSAAGSAARSAAWSAVWSAAWLEAPRSAESAAWGKILSYGIKLLTKGDN